ncbi:hypothetical protein BH11PSE11_BH11PSE11_22910 [soil metagenome]
MEAAEFRNEVIGQTVSHVWRGFGTAIFLELGRLRERGPRKDGSKRNPEGDISVMIEWSWRIERPKSILGGSFSSERKFLGMLEKFSGATITDMAVTSGLPELILSFSNGLKLSSYMTAEGQPSWAIITRRPNLGTLYVQRGKLLVESTPNISFDADAQARRST